MKRRRRTSRRRRATPAKSRLCTRCSRRELRLLGLLFLGLLVRFNDDIFQFVVSRPLDLGDECDLVRTQLALCRSILQ